MRGFADRWKRKPSARHRAALGGDDAPSEILCPSGQFFLRATPQPPDGHEPPSPLDRRTGPPNRAAEPDRRARPQGPNAKPSRRARTRSPVEEPSRRAKSKSQVAVRAPPRLSRETCDSIARSGSRTHNAQIPREGIAPRRRQTPIDPKRSRMVEDSQRTAEGSQTPRDPRRPPGA